MKVTLSLLFLALLLAAQLCFADDVPIPPPTADTTKKADTVLFTPGNSFDNATPVTDSANHEKNLIQNPTAALFKSMLLPGLGQIGNKAYTKAALFAGLDGWFIISAIKYGGDASDYKKQYSASTDLDTRNFYHDKYRAKASTRNFYTWMAVVTTIASMFDAFVDAHLSGSPKEQNKKQLSLSFEPPLNGQVAASVQIHF